FAKVLGLKEHHLQIPGSRGHGNYIAPLGSSSTAGSRLFPNRLFLHLRLFVIHVIHLVIGGIPHLMKLIDKTRHYKFLLNDRSLCIVQRAGYCRRPNRDEPTRTILAPHRMASSKSPDIPMDKYSMATLSLFLRFMSTKYSAIKEK